MKRKKRVFIKVMRTMIVVFVKLASFQKRICGISLRALPAYAQLVAISSISTGGDSQVSILIIYLWYIRVFTPENCSRLQAFPLTFRLVKLKDIARLMAIP